MSDEWLTYEEVAERLHVTLRAARARAFRGRWAKTQGNDGRARVRLPGEAPSPPRVMTVRPTESALLHALEGHVASLKAENERLAAQLTAAEARIERQAADFAGRETQLTAELEAERARTDKAIAAFASLADRLDALAAANQRRPWWKRLAG